MRKALIIALVCINAVLLVGLVVTSTQRTEAQAVRGGTDYLVVTGNIRTDYDAIYTLDLAKRRLLAWRMDKTKKELIPYRGRDLKNDFRREAE